MKRTVTLFLSMMIGIGLGVGAMLASTQVQAQQPSAEEPRLVAITATRGVATTKFGANQLRQVSQPPPPLVFLKDTKSAGCWLASLGERNEAISLAVAPVEACK